MYEVPVRLYRFPSPSLKRWRLRTSAHITISEDGEDQKQPERAGAQVSNQVNVPMR